MKSGIDMTEISEDHPLQKAARAVKEILPADYGFIILASPYVNSPSDQTAGYVATVDRQSAIAILKTVLFRWGVNEEWMKGAK